MLQPEFMSASDTTEDRFTRSSWSSRATGNESLNASVPHEKTRHRPTRDGVMLSLVPRRYPCPVKRDGGSPTENTASQKIAHILTSRSCV